MLSLVRTLLSVLAGVLVGALALGSILFFQHMQEFAWLHCVGILQVFALPLSLFGGALFYAVTLAAPIPARNRHASLFGLWLVVAPQLSFWLLATDKVFAATYVLVTLGFLVFVFIARKSSCQCPYAIRLPWLGNLALIFLAATFLWPGPPPNLGQIPSSAQQQAMGMEAASAEAPNLALIVLDTLRADHLGCYGYQRPTSPNLDRIATEGALFLHANSVATHTDPSHATMFTGLLPSEHGLSSAVSGMPTHMPTLAEVFSDAGWSTAGLTSNFVLRSRNGFNRGFHVYDDSLVLANALGRCARFLADSCGLGLSYGATALRGNTDINHMFGHFTRPLAIDGKDTTAHALQLLDAMAQEERPFFLFANYMDAHTPYQAPGEAMNQFLEHKPGRFAKRLSKLNFQKSFDALQVEIQNGVDCSEEVGALMDRYDAEIAYLDQQLPPLLEKIKAVSEAQNRDFLVILVGDHGEGFAEHGLLSHGKELWQECLHVPLIFWGSLAEPSVYEEEVSLLDLASTFTAAAGLAPLGRSQDLLTSRTRQAGHLVAEDGPVRSRVHFAPMNGVAVYHQGQKIIFEVQEEQKHLQATHAFHLRRDPLEQTPLSREQMQSLVQSLQEWQQRWWQTYLAGRALESESELNAIDAATLAELGYTADE